jgi:hypothetical protein
MNAHEQVREDHAVSIADMRNIVAEVWQAAVRRFKLRPGTPTEWAVGNILEELLKVVENRREKQYVQATTVKKVEERTKTVVVRGFGKDAVTDEVFDGWWITFTDSLTALRCETKPDCQPGDTAICTWEFRRKA